MEILFFIVKRSKKALMHALWERVSEGRDPVDAPLTATLCEQAERNSVLRTELLLYVQRKLFAEDEQSCEAGV